MLPSIAQTRLLPGGPCLTYVQYQRGAGSLTLRLAWNTFWQARECFSSASGVNLLAHSLHSRSSTCRSGNASGGRFLA